MQSRNKKLKSTKVEFLTDINFNPIQDGFFQGCSQMGEKAKKSPPPLSLKSVTQSYNTETWQLYLD